MSTQPHQSHITSHTCDQRTSTVKATLAINTTKAKHSSGRVAAHGCRGRRGSLYYGAVVAIVVVVVVVVSLLQTFTTQMTHKYSTYTSLPLTLPQPTTHTHIDHPPTTPLISTLPQHYHINHHTYILTLPPLP